MSYMIDDILYRAGLTAQGCWDELDEYAQEAIIRSIKMTVQECVSICEKGTATQTTCSGAASMIKQHFEIDNE